MLLPSDSEPWEHVVGIDPGETTGLCAIRLALTGPSLFNRVSNGDVFQGQLNRESCRLGPMPLRIAEAKMARSLAGRLQSLAQAWALDCLHLSIEDFVLQERTKERSLLSPVRMTSGLLALLEEHDEVYVVHSESAADAKSIVKDALLKKLGLYQPGQTHSNDAARHAVLTLKKEHMV